MSGLSDMLLVAMVNVVSHQQPLHNASHSWARWSAPRPHCSPLSLLAIS